MTLPLPIQVEIGAKLSGGAPDWSTPTTIASVTKWSQTIVDRGGFESATATLDDQVTLLDEAAALAWLDPANLMRPIRAKARSDGHVVWVGVLTGVRASINGKTFSIDLADMANRLVVRYQVAGSNAQKASTALEDAASIAAYGRKDRVLSLDGTTDAGALARAQTGLNQIAYPQSRESSDAAYDALLTPDLYHRSVSVELQCMGVYGLLGNVTYSTTSTTMTATSTQVATLLTAYAGVNAYFDAGAVSIVATGVSETEHADDDTTYLAKIEKLLALGNASHERLAWGFDAAGFVVAVSARATPTTIHYHEYTRTGLITDTAGTPIAPWDVVPNRMAQIVDVTAAAPPSGAIDGPTRKYVARVRCEVSETAAKASLEPDNDDPLDALLAHPVGNPTTDAGARTSAIASTVAQLVKPIASPTNGAIDLSGGKVTNPSGTDKDLDQLAPKPPPGSSYPKTTGGTPPQLAKWTASDALGNSGMAVDVTGATNGQALVYESSSGLWKPGTGGLPGSGIANHLTMWGPGGTSLTDSAIAITSGHDGGTMAMWDLGSGVLFEVFGKVDLVGFGTGGTLTFQSGAGLRVDAFLEIDPTGATNGQVLAYNLGADKWVPSSAGALIGIGSGTPGRVIQWGPSGDTLVDSTLIKSGAGVLTIAAASTQTLTISGSAGGTLALGGFTLTLDGSLRASGAGATTGQILRFNGTAFVPATTAGGILGSGTTGRITQWAAGGTTLQDSTLVKTGSGILTLTSGTDTMTLALAGAGSTLTFQAGLGTAYTLTAAKTGTLPVGTGTTNKITYWTDANTIAASLIDISSITTGGGSGVAGRVAQWSSTSNLTAATLIKGGAGVLTLSAASDMTLTIGSGGGTLTLGGNTLVVSGGSLTLATGNYTFTIPKTGTAVVGTGTASKSAYWTDANTIAAGDFDPTSSGTAGRVAEWDTGGFKLKASTLIKTGSGVLTVGSGTDTMSAIFQGNGSTLTILAGVGTAYSFTIPATGTAALGTGVAGYVASWTDANTLQSGAKLVADLVTTSAGSANRIPFFSAATTLNASDDLVWNGSQVAITGGLAVLGSIAGVDLYDRAGASNWSIYNSGNLLRFWRGGDTFRMSTSSLYPVGALGLGESGNPWGDTFLGVTKVISIQTSSGNKWKFGAYSGGAGVATGEINIEIDGTIYHLLART